MQTERPYFVSNPNDRKHPGLAKATELPNIPYFPAKALPKIPLFNHASQTFLMVGTFDYSANRDGVDAFIKQAWPEIRAKFPGAQLSLVGRGISESQRQSWASHQGVNPIGYIPNLESAYKDCIATIAPILAGGGTNIKVLESAAFGRPSILTKIAHRGFEATLPPNSACAVCPGIKEMASQCIQFLETPELAEKMGLEASKQIAAHHTRSNFEATVKKLCLHVLSQTKHQAVDE